MQRNTKSGPLRPMSKLADEQPGVIAVDRALSILRAFDATRLSMGLAELAHRTGLHKATVLRLARSLIAARLLSRNEDGIYRIGPDALRLGSLYQSAHSAEQIVLPAMRALAQKTKESVAFYVRDGDDRVCLHRVDSDQPIRYYAREGDRIPLTVGAHGSVLLAFSGGRGKKYDLIRERLYYYSRGEVVADVGSVSTPVFGVGDVLVGSIGLSGPLSRVNDRFVADNLVALIETAARATRQFGGDSGRHTAAIERLTAMPVVTLRKSI